MIGVSPSAAAKPVSRLEAELLFTTFKANRLVSAPECVLMACAEVSLKKC